eukprot:TRINITY_DN6492_c0_g1_i1.p3 TRINITY_DN6492_c0_g1~~TRINITY_DN6492_c0_g1_i1.p3  ORF type:complete len:122 (+),score=7.08 TRINITY_DN6492_c0_g1_i1:171-536(+)
MNKTTMAFAVNETGISVPLEQASSLRVYDLQSGKWTVSREWNIRELSITISESINDAVRAIAALLQDCFTLVAGEPMYLSLIHISEPTRLGMISYAVFCLKKKKKQRQQLDHICVQRRQQC